MSEMVSTLWNVSLLGSEFIVLAANESKYDGPVQRAFDRAAKKFGEEIGPLARVVRSYPGASRETYNELRNKVWPQDFIDRLKENDCAVLIFLKRDFKDFDPKNDEWYAAWFSALGNQQNGIANFFDRVTRALDSEPDLFRFLESKLDGKDPYFPKGTLSARNRAEVLPAPRKWGREGILDEKPDIAELRTLRGHPVRCVSPYRVGTPGRSDHCQFTYRFGT